MTDTPALDLEAETCELRKQLRAARNDVSICTDVIRERDAEIARLRALAGGREALDECRASLRECVAAIKAFGQGNNSALAIATVAEDVLRRTASPTPPESGRAETTGQKFVEMVEEASRAPVAMEGFRPTVQHVPAGAVGEGEIGGTNIAGLPLSASDLEKCFRETSYLAPLVKGWAVEHALGLWKAMCAWRFEHPLPAPQAPPITEDYMKALSLDLARVQVEFDEARAALNTIASQSDEAMIASAKSDPLWAKRVAVAALAVQEQG